MAEKEKVEVEVVEPKDEAKEQPKEETKEGTEKKEKKDNAFSKWWNKTKENVKDSILESNIEGAYNKKYGKFTIYSYGGFLNSSEVHGEIVDGKLIYFGEKAFEEFSVIVDNFNDKAYYAGKSSKTEVEIMYEGVNYTRPGTQIELDENVEEVNVVKAGSRYFIYKGEPKKDK